MANITAQHAFRAGLAVAIIRKLPLDYNTCELADRLTRVLRDNHPVRFAAIRRAIRAETEAMDDSVMQDAMTGVLVLLCP